MLVVTKSTMANGSSYQFQTWEEVRSRSARQQGELGCQRSPITPAGPSVTKIRRKPLLGPHTHERNRDQYSAKRARYGHLTVIFDTIQWLDRVGVPHKRERCDRCRKKRRSLRKINRRPPLRTVNNRVDRLDKKRHKAPFGPILFGFSTGSKNRIKSANGSPPA